MRARLSKTRCKREFRRGVERRVAAVVQLLPAKLCLFAWLRYRFCLNDEKTRGFKRVLVAAVVAENRLEN